MPKHTTPNGRADLDRIGEDLLKHLRRHARGTANIIGTRQLCEMYDIKPWQVYACVTGARSELRLEDEVLCSRTGPGGGWFIAETEDEARLYGIRRTETALTMIENTVLDMETAVLGVVRSEPLMAPYWKRTRGRLVGVAKELTRVRYELTVAAVDAEEVPALEAGSEDDAG